MVSPSVLHSALLAPFHLREKEWDVRSLVEKVSKKNKKLVGLLLLEENHSHFVLAANLTSSSAIRSFIPISWNPLSSNLFKYILAQFPFCSFFFSLSSRPPWYNPSNYATLHPVRFDHYVGLLHALHLLWYLPWSVIYSIQCIEFQDAQTLY